MSKFLLKFMKMNRGFKVISLGLGLFPSNSAAESEFAAWPKIEGASYYRGKLFRGDSVKKFLTRDTKILIPKNSQVEIKAISEGQLLLKVFSPDKIKVTPISAGNEQKSLPPPPNSEENPEDRDDQKPDEIVPSFEPPENATELIEDDQLRQWPEWSLMLGFFLGKDRVKANRFFSTSLGETTVAGTKMGLGIAWPLINESSFGLDLLYDAHNVSFLQENVDEDVKLRKSKASLIGEWTGQNQDESWKYSVGIGFGNYRVIKVGTENEDTGHGSLTAISIKAFLVALEIKKLFASNSLTFGGRFAPLGIKTESFLVKEYSITYENNYFAPLGIHLGLNFYQESYELSETCPEDFNCTQIPGGESSRQVGIFGLSLTL